MSATLDGHVDTEHALSPRAAFEKLGTASRLLVQYEASNVWERETATLPRAQQRLRRTMRDFAREQLAPIALAEDLRTHTPVAETSEPVQRLLRIAGEAGYLSDLLPRPIGSAPATRFRHPLAWQQCIKAEELAAACGGLALLLCAHGLGAAPVVLSGDMGAIRRFLLPAFRASKSGSPHLFAFAITEPAMGSDAEDGHGAQCSRPGTVARKVEGGWRLTGRKCFISGGDLARSITVFAALEGEGMDSWTCFLVQSDMPGYSVARSELKMGQRASAAAELVFDDVFVPDDHVIGELRSGWALNRAVLNYSRAPVAALALGMARGAMEVSIDFVCRTQLGGRALVHRQDVQLTVAQMIADTSAMRALVWQAARTMVPTQSAVSTAKFHVSDAAVRVCEMAMDLMSNHGVLHRNRAEKAFRDARLTQIYEGTNQINRLAVIEDLAEELAPSRRQP